MPNVVFATILSAFGIVTTVIEAAERILPQMDQEFSQSLAMILKKRGFVKVVFGAKTDTLIGAQLMCQRATDMIDELTTVVSAGLTARQLPALSGRTHIHRVYRRGCGGHARARNPRHAKEKMK